MVSIDLNSDEVVKFSAKLERMSRSALPVAVRGALNNAAFDVKQNTMLKTSAAQFKNRQANFFKANSKVQMAGGFDVNSMEAIVGFIEKGLKGSSNYAVKDLEQQENGGTIKAKSLIPMSGARMSKSDMKPVKSINRMSAITNVVNARNLKASTARQRFRIAASVAGVGGYIVTDKALFRVDSMKKITPLYSFKKGRTVRVKATGFMQRASIQSGKKIESYFIEQAEKQFKKLM